MQEPRIHIIIILAFLALVLLTFAVFQLVLLFTAQPQPTPVEIIPPAVTPELAMCALPNLKIPILAYHQIRNYKNPQDPLGIKYSVSPQNLIMQLDWLQEHGYRTITFQDILSGRIPEKPVILTFDDGRRNFYTFAYQELIKRKMKAVIYVITEAQGPSFLNKEQIKELARDGMEIGSHTLTHPRLTEIPSEKAREEIYKSKQAVEKLTGRPCLSFCYPHALFNDEIVQQAREAGYRFALKLGGETADFADPWRLARYLILFDTSISRFLK